MNPPYGRTLATRAAKAHTEVESARAETVMARLPARPDTNYWYKHIAGRAAFDFPRGRLRFGDG